MRLRVSTLRAARTFPLIADKDGIRTGELDGQSSFL